MTPHVFPGGSHSQSLFPPWSEGTTGGGGAISCISPPSSQTTDLSPRLGWVCVSYEPIKAFKKIPLWPAPAFPRRYRVADSPDREGERVTDLNHPTLSYSYKDKTRRVSGGINFILFNKLATLSFNYKMPSTTQQ